jgi:hypothetical protein
VQGILAGNFFETSVLAAGVSLNAAYLWIQRGEGRAPERPRRPIFARFARAVRKAEAIAEARIVGVLRDAIPNDPKLALEFLGRRFAKRWAKKDSTEVNASVAMHVIEELIHSDNTNGRPKIVGQAEPPALEAGPDAREEGTAASGTGGVSAQ